MLPFIITAGLLSMTISLSGVVFFRRFAWLYRSLDMVISCAVGAFLATVFLGLLPGAMHHLSASLTGAYILGGFLLFVGLSHFLSLYHHHHAFTTTCRECHTQARAWLVLVGDSVHNFVDGIIIAVAFLSGVEIGCAVTVGVLLHELPQEIAEYFVLISSGYSRKKALLYNFLASSSILAGGGITYVFATYIESAVGPLLALAAGNLLYIAASDLLPDLFSENNTPVATSHFIKQFAMIGVGVVIISTTILVSGHTHDDDHTHEITPSFEKISSL